jgi:hypothetical protein
MSAPLSPSLLFQMYILLLSYMERVVVVGVSTHAGGALIKVSAN